MDNLSCALDYLDKGICILPVRPMEKRPYMSNWHKYITNKPTHDDLKSWFGSLSGAGVGAVTGAISGFVVLDIDNRFQGDVEEIIKQYPTDMISKSGSGGYHLFYRYPQGSERIQNAVNLLDGIDLRADGGFIVLPPTIHPTGNAYQWIKQGIMGEFPKELIALRQQGSNQNSERWLTDTLRGVGSGGRNNAAAKLAGYFFSKGLNADVVECLLLEWNTRNDPPLPIQELLVTIKSIQRNHGPSTKQALQVEFIDDRFQTNVNNKSDVGGFGLVSLKNYFSKYGTEGSSWLVEDWLPIDAITFLISPPESYKTWILLDLAVSVASGAPFLGKYVVNRPGPVMLIQQEDAHGEITERLSVIIQSRMNLHVTTEPGQWPVEVPILPDLPIYIHPDRQLRFEDKGVMDALEQAIATVRPSVVLIDPLYSTTSTDNYMAGSAEKMLRLKTIRDKYKCSFVLAHHSKKNVDPDSTAREDAWGSQFLNAFLETGWQVRRSAKLEDTEIVVRRHSKSMGNIAPVILKFDISTKGGTKYGVSVKDYAAARAGVSGPMEEIVLLLSASQKPMSQTEISERLGKSKSTISRQLSKLKETNVIQLLEDGKYTNLTEEE